MAYQKSISDALSDALAPLSRAKVNLTNTLGGTRAYILRITEYSSDPVPGQNYDIFGFNEKKLNTDGLTSDVLTNIGMSYPTGTLEVFSERANGISRIKSTDFLQLVPIEMIISFNDSTSQQVLYNQYNQPITLHRGDILVDVFRDEHGSKIPVVMRLENELIVPWQKNIVMRKFQLTVELADLSIDIQNKIDEWVSNLE